MPTNPKSGGQPVTLGQPPPVATRRQRREAVPGKTAGQGDDRQAASRNRPGQQERPRRSARRHGDEATRRGQRQGARASGQASRQRERYRATRQPVNRGPARMGGGDTSARAVPDQAPIASRRANGEHRQPARHGDATRDDGIRANGATHAQRPPASLPSRGQIHQGEGPRPAQIARTTHRQPASPIENRTLNQTWQPPGKGPGAAAGPEQLGALKRQGEISARQGGAASGGGGVSGQHHLTSPGRRGGGQRARPPHGATDTNAHISRPTQDNARKRPSRRARPREGAGKNRQAGEGRSPRRTARQAHTDPERCARSTTRPENGGGNGKEARSGRRSRHGAPPGRPAPGNRPAGGRPPAPPRGGIAPPVLLV